MSTTAWLLKACIDGNLKKAQKVVDEGADIHIENDWPLRLAVKYGHLNIVKFLVSRGANIHAEKDLAIWMAKKYQKKEVVDYLTELGC